MGASLLTILRGELPTESALDLVHRVGLDEGNFAKAWGPPIQPRPKGDVCFVYPFKKSYVALTDPSGDMSQATEAQKFEAKIRGEIEDHVAMIRQQAALAGCCGFKTEYVLQEALRNATSYLGAEGSGHSIIRLEWEISADPHEPRVALAIANPVRRLFDPGQYLQISLDEWLATLPPLEPSTGPEFTEDLSAESDDNRGDLVETPEKSGNEGVKLMARLSEANSELVYLWDLPDHGGRIRYSIRPDEDSDSGDFSLRAEKFDSSSLLVEGYDRDSFYHDVSAELAVTTVSVAMTIGKPTPQTSE